VAREQPGFDGLLRQAEDANRLRRFERASGHLPSELEAAIRLHRQQIKQHDAAVRALDLAAAEAINKEAHLMAVRVNHGEAGILASKDSPGSILTTRCAARAGKVPLWGQAGRFTLMVAGVPVLVAMDGMFGLCGSISGFSTHVVDQDRPFVSPTGYRSFLCCRVELVAGMTTGDFAQRAIADHVAGEMKGKLVPIDPRHRRS
jgi:hypothetical protein